MQKIRIMCYGDSNTWGAIVPGYINPFDRSERRYTKLLQKYFGRKAEVIEEGFIARTADSDDIRAPKGNRNGSITFVQYVCSHDPLDYVVIMLGTNDMKEEFKKSPEDVIRALKKKYIEFMRNDLKEVLTTMPKVVIIAPPVIEELGGKYVGAREKSLRFRLVYEQFAKENNCLFVDNVGVTVGPDGVHMNANGHRVLAKKLYEVIKQDVKGTKKGKQ